MWANKYTMIQWRWQSLHEPNFGIVGIASEQDNIVFCEGVQDFTKVLGADLHGRLALQAFQQAFKPCPLNSLAPLCPQALLQQFLYFTGQRSKRASRSSTTSCCDQIHINCSWWGEWVYVATPRTGWLMVYLFVDLWQPAEWPPSPNEWPQPRQYVPPP